MKNFSPFPASRSRMVPNRIMPAVILAGIVLSTPARAQTGAAFLNAANFGFLGGGAGAFNPTADVLVDLKTGRMSGGASFTGVTFTQAGAALLVFTFSTFNLQAGVSITFMNDGGGSGAVAFLSQGDMTIAGSILGNGHDGMFSSEGQGGPSGGNGDGGPGAGGPGWAVHTTGGNGFPATVLTGGGGGGYGGAGGNGDNEGARGAAGGISYNTDLSSRLMGGSGGGSGAGAASAGGPGGGGPGFGGGGGGALQIGALGSLTISGTVSANGGQGAYAGSGGGGGGSGGGILIQADNVAISVDAVVSAQGATGFGAAEFTIVPGFVYGTVGGGGGGGRIFIGYHDSGIINGGVNAGGAGGGATGTVVVAQSNLVPVAAPLAPPTLRAALGAGNTLLLEILGAPGQPYILQSASSLLPPITWQPVFTNTADAGGNGSFTNAALPSQGAVFYRVAAP